MCSIQNILLHYTVPKTFIYSKAGTQCLRANCNAYSLARYCPHSRRTITLLRRRPYPNRDKTLAYCLHPSPILMYLSVQLYISFILKKQFFYLLMIFSILTVCCHPFPSFKSIYSSIFVKSSFTSHFKEILLAFIFSG